MAPAKSTFHNKSTSTLNVGAAYNYVTLSGTIGGATGTGAPITITNSAPSTSYTAFNITNTLGASVSSITQNATHSVMSITGASTAFAGTTTVSLEP